MTGSGLNDWGLIPLHHHVQTSFGHAACVLGVKQVEHIADHSCLPTTKVYNAWSFTSTHLTCFNDVMLRHMNYFTIWFKIDFVYTPMMRNLIWSSKWHLSLLLKSFFRYRIWLILVRVTISDKYYVNLIHGLTVSVQLIKSNLPCDNI
jgi:hypothetical protein